MFGLPAHIADEHSNIRPDKTYTNEEKYTFCKELLIHMKEEEAYVKSIGVLVS